MWGDNTEGQIGLGKESHAPSPQEVSVGGAINWVSCGYYHSALVTGERASWAAFYLHAFLEGDGVLWAVPTAGGALYTFGERDSGKLGLTTEQLPRHRVPQPVRSIKEPVRQVACGGGHTVALTGGRLTQQQPRCVLGGSLLIWRFCLSEDRLFTFGLGQFGQLGHGTFIFETRLPRPVEHFKKGRVCQVACGENHSAVVTGKNRRERHAAGGQRLELALA